jgi:hypothetical protein
MVATNVGLPNATVAVVAEGSPSSWKRNRKKIYLCEMMGRATNKEKLPPTKK